MLNIQFKTDIIFNSETYGILNFSQVVSHIVDFMEKDSLAKYSFIIGTDSTANNNGGEIDYITAILVHRVGLGGIYFWHKLPSIGYSINERIFKEAALSLEFTEAFLNELNNRNVHNFSFEIHVDVGENGKTKEIISQVVGMIKGSGHKVVTKPNGYVASKVADRHT